jgi:molybdate transport system ATP-binding protein
MVYWPRTEWGLIVLRVQIQQTLPNPLLLQLEVAAGEVHALVGPSGSGKTSVLRSIAGLHHPEIGFIECNGDIWLNRDSARGALVALAANQRSCGFLFQQYALFPHLNALENVCIALHNQIPDSTARRQKAQDWLNQLEIGDLSARLPRQLSGGQQQRVALARALARSPKILLLDEPFSAIDIPTRQKLYQTLASLRKQLNIPMILVTHDLREANLLADQITVIDQGVGLQTVSPQALFTKPRNARVAQLVGIPNLFHGAFNAGALSWGESPWVFQIKDKGRIPPNSQVAWVIPQEGISVHRDSGLQRIPCQVKQISALGQIALIEFCIQDIAETLTWEASVAEVKRLQLDKDIGAFLEFETEQIHIMPLRPINDPRRFMSASQTNN